MNANLSSNRKVPFSRVDCDGNELEYIRQVLESGWLTTAGKAREFETRFAADVGAKHALAVNSCTAGLHLALEAIGIGPGDRVLVPTLTFTATAEVARYLNADLVLCDIDERTGLVTPEIVDSALAAHPDVKAFLPVHYAGQTAQMLDDPERGEGLLAVCRRRGVKIVEDAAHAFPARRQGRTVGALGDLTCFSFYANKTITTGEGGMVTTEDDALASRIRVMRLHGIDRDVWTRYTNPKASWEYDVIAPGYKYNMPDLNAAIGLAQLERAEEMRKRRQDAVQLYRERLRDFDAVQLLDLEVAPEDHAWHIFVVRVSPKARHSRNDLIPLLNERGVGTSVHYKPLHRMTYYRDRYQLDPTLFPQAERFWNSCLALPLYPSIAEEEIDWVCQTLEELLG